MSKVLGKHYPVKPSMMRNIYQILGKQLACMDLQEPVLAVGMAETATGFGQGVFEELMLAAPALDGLYIHTTRYGLARKQALAFKESHSHATDHILYEPCIEKDRELFYQAQTLILLDDEISTGATFENLLNGFKSINPHLQRVVLVSITNWMNPDLQKNLIERVNTSLRFVNILKGRFSFVADTSFQSDARVGLSIRNNEPKDHCLPRNFGRLGYRNAPPINMSQIAAQLNLLMADRVLVLGTGEFNFLPFKLAEIVEKKGIDVFFQSTTRSPILIDGEIHCKISFKDNYFDGIDNFIYNVRPKEYSKIIVCYETMGLPRDHQLINALNAQPVFF